jgi:hypothetical protein
MVRNTWAMVRLNRHGFGFRAGAVLAHRFGSLFLLSHFYFCKADSRYAISAYFVLPHENMFNMLHVKPDRGLMGLEWPRLQQAAEMTPAAGRLVQHRTSQAALQTLTMRQSASSGLH